MRKLAILVGGGPAPGLNGVIASVTRRAHDRGLGVCGIPEGFSQIMKGITDGARELSPALVEGLETRGGSILFTSRANPTKDAAHLEAVVKSLATLGADGLVTIGGDDTATSAAKVAAAAGGRLRVAHVPKTIDNDLPLPPGVPTFGFTTARELGARLVANLAEDARTTRRFYLVTAMGRSAGHLALGIGQSSGAILTLIPEEFGAKVKLEGVVARVQAAFAKRVADGQPYGVVVMAEGLLDRMDPSEMQELRNVERDEHGHPRLSEISLGKIVKDVLAQRLLERGRKATFVAKEIGYELRCQDPSAYDVAYTRGLGAAAVDFLAEGSGHAMITIQNGRATPVPLDALRDPATGKTRVRLVDTSDETYRNLRRLEARLSPADLAQPRIAKLAAAVGMDASEFERSFAPLAEAWK
ncbi:MAG TPA: 6-phosphofructokinase [Candidatus Thermoplasmatota archaeon]|nr:6-phosphofructokinase [Candidatus Thermoplasmatota archaeon]